MASTPSKLAVDSSRLAELSQQRWSTQQAQDWYAQQAWPCGCNFLPSTAVNFIAMWQAASFDLPTLKRELAWAQQVGFNTLRTNLPYTVWQADPTGLKQRMQTFLSVAARHQLSVVFCLFDDCGFSGEEPNNQQQPEPVAGVHNSRAMASPGRKALLQSSNWLKLQAYVQDIIHSFAHDSRILFWDLYNEPGNAMIFDSQGQHEFDHALEAASLNLLLDTFAWARACQPSQPLSTGGWHVPLPWVSDDTHYFEHSIDQTAFALSDIINFHAYLPRSAVQHCLNLISTYERPVMCTEWMARSIGSRIEEQLPLFQAHKVGSWQWGLVKGRTQTHIPWPAVKLSLADYQENTSEWFHDLLHDDGRPYAATEVALIQQLRQAS